MNYQDKNYKAVQVHMRDKTLETVEDLKNLLDTNNRSEIIKMSVDIARIVAKVLKDGGTVILEKSNGGRTQLVIPGISHA